MELTKKRIVVIGGGIVGLTIARELIHRWPDSSITVLEKEARVGLHQTGHNSGVIHSGVYYQPGSHKAILAREGMRRMVDFCKTNSIPYEQCGKLIIATERSELPYLEELKDRGLKNQLVGIRVLEKHEMNEIEPYAAGIRALFVPQAGIVDYKQVLEVIRHQLTSSGVNMTFNCRVLSGEQKRGEWVLETQQGTISTDFVVNCGGLFSDRLCRQLSQKLDVQIVPFRGEYFSVGASGKHLVKNLIYPVPKPSLPFLGVHLSRCIDGRLEAGPNAVLAWAREGYTHTDIVLRDLWDYATYSGFWKMAWQNMGIGLSEYYRSMSKRRFLASLQELVPTLEADHLHPSGSGVRAQVVLKNGALLNDFLFLVDKSCLHVVNAPSPAATASLAIAEHLVNEIAKQ